MVKNSLNNYEYISLLKTYHGLLGGVGRYITDVFVFKYDLG